jgi:hypothetical protein
MPRCRGAALEGAREGRTAEERGDRDHHRRHGDQEPVPVDATGLFPLFPGPVLGGFARPPDGVAGPEEQVIQVRLEGKQRREWPGAPSPRGPAATIADRTAHIR